MRPVLRVKRLRDTAALPAYAYEGDAGLDLTAQVDCTIAPFERVLVPCGIAVEIPDGHAGLVLPRSGLASRKGLTLANAPGLIDSHYRGEIKAALVNIDAVKPVEVHTGDRIAQLVIIETPQMTVEEADELTETSRGTGGFGSSGVST